MIAIDWSKAPEGATHAAACGDDYLWYSLDHAVLIARPVEWDGQDRPPIGTVCEVYSDSPHADWKDHVGKVVFIVAHDAMRAVYRFETDSGLGYHALGGGADGKSYPFRPIRAPEQAAAENREQAARELFEAVNPEGQWHKFHADGKRRYLAAIDAGFGKQVKP
jgi:hypothetical protein